MHLGFSIGVPNKAALEDVVYAAKKHLAERGVDTLIAEFDNGMKTLSHPEIWESDLLPEDIEKAAEECRKAGIEFVPLYNTIGHQGWKRRNSLLKAYPELEETPDKAIEDFLLPCRHEDGSVDMLDVTPGWCMNEPKVFDIVLPVIDEIIAASKCSTMHLGMDEIFWFNQCPRCRDIPARDLFYNSFMRFYRHLKEKNVRTMMWGDRLLSAKRLLCQEDPQRRWWDYDTYGASDCLPDMPRDVIACNWHYEVEKSYPSTGDLIKNGLYAFPSCWRNPEAAKALWEDSVKQAQALDREDHLYGLLVTYWGACPLGLTGMFEKQSQLSPEDQGSVNTLNLAQKMLRK